MATIFRQKDCPHPAMLYTVQDKDMSNLFTASSVDQRVACDSPGETPM